MNCEWEREKKLCIRKIVIKDFCFIFDDDPLFFKCQSLSTKKDGKFSWIPSILCPSAQTNETRTRNVFSSTRHSTFFNTMNILLPCSYLEVCFEFRKRNKKKFLDVNQKRRRIMKQENVTKEYEHRKERKKTHFDIRKKCAVCISAPNDISRIQSNCLYSMCVFACVWNNVEESNNGNRYIIYA